MRESLADIVGSFRSPYPEIDQKRGLRAEYFDSRKFSKRSLVLERLDPKIQFSFGEASPLPKKCKPERSLHPLGRLCASSPRQDAMNS